MTIKAKILPLGKVYVYGSEEIEFTKEMLEQIVENFQKGYPHYTPYLDINHEHDEKLGEISALELLEDGVYATIELNQTGEEIVKKKLYTYLSAELDMNYVDRTTGENVGIVLLSVALTNNPALPLPAIQFSETKNIIYTSLKFKRGDNKHMFREFLEILKSMFSDDANFAEETYQGFVLERSKAWDWDWSTDANAIIEKLGWAGLAKVCLYVDTENYETGESGYPENKQAYYFPFAKLERDGKLHAYFRAFSTIAAYLNGARGGVDLPRKVKDEIWEKVVEWYQAFGEEPPEKKFSESQSQSEVMQVNEDILKQNEELKKQLEELQQKLAEYMQKEKVEKVENWKKEVIAKGVVPTFAEKVATLLLSDKIDETTANELVESAKVPELTKQFADLPSRKEDPVEQIAKLMNWKK